MRREPDACRGLGGGRDCRGPWLLWIRGPQAAYAPGGSVTLRAVGFIGNLSLLDMFVVFQAT